MIEIETVRSASGATATRAAGHYCDSGVTYRRGAPIPPPEPTAATRRRALPSAAERALAAWMRARTGGPIGLRAVAKRLGSSQAVARDVLAALVRHGLARESVDWTGALAWIATPQQPTQEPVP